jgi:peptide/nickel transport system substrate-binding protein
MRDDVTFHNGDKMTAEDFEYTFFERIRPATRSTPELLAQGDHRNRIAHQGVMSSTRRRRPPQWLAFLGSFMVPKGYMERWGRVPRQTGRHRAVQARRIPAEFAHRARAQRQLLGHAR